MIPLYEHIDSRQFRNMFRLSTRISVLHLIGPIACSAAKTEGPLLPARLAAKPVSRYTISEISLPGK
jgi:hypothetical protein